MYFIGRITMPHAPLDPGLLVALDVLLAERSVTRAARRLGVTQSAVSHKLRALREQLGDPLLVAANRELRPTDRALAIAAPLRAALLDLHAATERGASFDPLRARRTFSLSTGDYGELVALPKVTARLEKIAPGVDLRLEPPYPDFAERLTDGRLDAAVAPAMPVPSSLMRTKILTEGFTVVLRREHRVLRRRWTLDRYLELNHLLIAPRGARGSIVDDVLEKHDLKRRVALRVSSFVAAPFIVAESNLCLTAPTRLVETLAPRLRLATRTVPIAVPIIDTFLYWHARVDRDPAHRWFRELVVSTTRDRAQ
jgi:DNA-binding transcriptional LysR family regulator